jgi:hypothetical protein
MNGAVVVDVVQGTPEWLQARCAKLTGTAAADMLATVKKKGEEAAARRDLRLRLVVERLTQRPQENGYVSPDMQWGLDHEADARRAYEVQSGEVVNVIGFLEHPSLPVGCSLDGAVNGGTGIIEIKCPRSAQHLRAIRSSTLLPEYQPQVFHNLWVSEARWADFISFDPRFPPPLQLVVVRVTMTPAERAAYELIVRQFLAEVDSEFAAVEALLHAKAGGR